MNSALEEMVTPEADDEQAALGRIRQILAGMKQIQERVVDETGVPDDIGPMVMLEMHLTISMREIIT